MAVFTTLTAPDIQACLAPHGLALQSYAGVAEGTQNTLYRVETSNGTYLLTLFEPPLAHDDLNWFINVHSQLHQQGFPCPAPLNQQLHHFQGKPYCLFNFIEGRHPAPTTQQAYAIGNTLAQLHSTKLSVPAKANVWGINTMQHEAQHLEGSNWSETLAAARTFLKSIQVNDLPQGLIHADLFPDNALFEGNTLNGVIDFFFACHDAYAYDLAISLSSWCFNKQNQYQADIAAALLQGYQEVRPLNADEQRALPQLLQLACVRFFLSRLKAYELKTPQKMGALHAPGVYAARLKHYQQQAQ